MHLRRFCHPILKVSQLYKRWNWNLCGTFGPIMTWGFIKKRAKSVWGGTCNWHYQANVKWLHFQNIKPLYVLILSWLNVKLEEQLKCLSDLQFSQRLTLENFCQNCISQMCHWFRCTALIFLPFRKDLRWLWTYLGSRFLDRKINFNTQVCHQLCTSNSDCIYN